MTKKSVKIGEKPETNKQESSPSVLYLKSFIVYIITFTWTTVILHRIFRQSNLLFQMLSKLFPHVVCLDIIKKEEPGIFFLMFPLDMNDWFPGTVQG